MVMNTTGTKIKCSKERILEKDWRVIIIFLNRDFREKKKAEYS